MTRTQWLGAPRFRRRRRSSSSGAKGVASGREGGGAQGGLIPCHAEACPRGGLQTEQERRGRGRAKVETVYMATVAAWSG